MNKEILYVKVCTKCKLPKPPNEFNKDKRSKSGLQSSCNLCKRKYYQSNRDKIINNMKVYYQANKEHKKEYDQKYYRDNKEEFAQNNGEYYQANKEKVKASVKTYREANQGKVNALKAKYKSDKLQQTPAWADLKAIEQIYINCPSGMEVDHIVPLRGKNVRGFHVEYNLQYLTKSENARKRNKFKG